MGVSLVVDSNVGIKQVLAFKIFLLSSLIETLIFILPFFKYRTKFDSLIQYDQARYLP